LSEDSLFYLPSGQVIVFDGERYVDAATGSALASEPEAPEPVVVNNVVRGALESAVALRALASVDPAARLAAAEALKQRAPPSFLPALEAALAKETDTAVQDALARTTALLHLSSPDKAVKLAAIERWESTRTPVPLRQVGIDEADMTKGRVSWIAPIALALMKASEGDEIAFRAPGGVETLEVVEIRYIPVD